MDKVILINPPFKFNQYSFTSKQYPVNLGYLASILLKENFYVEIWDYSVEKFTIEKFRERIKSTNPKIVGFSSITPSIKNSHKIANIIKKISKEIIIVVGAAHITALPDETLKEFPDFDLGVSGEGEETFLEVVRYCIYNEGKLEDIKGIVYRDRDDIKVNEKRKLIPDLDSIPFPNRELVDHRLYKSTHPTKIIVRSEKNINEILTARGCPYQCSFCAGHEVFQYTTRFRSAENVIREIEECKNKFKTNHITFLDNVFTLNKERVKIICSYLRDNNFTFDCNSRVDTIDEELVYLMKESGCEKISFGIESGNNRILNFINKGTNISKIKETINLVKKAGIPVVEGTAILGSHPTETKDEVKETVSLLHNLDLDYVVVNVIVPYPGSPIYYEMKKRGLIKNKDWDKYVPYGEIPCWRTENFSEFDLVKMQKKIMLGFYFRPKYIIKKLRKIKNLKEFVYHLKILFDYLIFTSFRKFKK